MDTTPFLIVGAVVLAIVFAFGVRSIRKNAAMNAAKRDREALIAAVRANVDLADRKDIARLYLALANLGGYHLGECVQGAGGKFKSDRDFAHMVATQTLTICHDSGYGRLGHLKTLDSLQIADVLVKLADNDAFVELCIESAPNLNHFLDYYYGITANNDNVPSTFRIPNDKMVTDKTVKRLLDLRPHSM